MHRVDGRCSRTETIAFIGGNESEKFPFRTNSMNLNRKLSKIRRSKSPSNADVGNPMDREGDVFFSPYQSTDNEFGVETTINALHVECNETEAVPSMVTSKGKGRPTLSSLESDTATDLEAAIPLRPKVIIKTTGNASERQNTWTREKRKSSYDNSPRSESSSRPRSRNSTLGDVQNHPLHSSDGAKRRRLSKRARTRLTMREVNSHIQPGRHYSSLESMCHFEKRKTITIPKIIDFFLRVEGKLIAVNVILSTAITLIVVFAFPSKWQDSLKSTSLPVSILGAFLSFALVFRTQTCYDRWWEARTQWGRMTSACVNIAGQARNWFSDEDLVDKFLTHCIVFPYACKALLRGNQLNDPVEEGPRFLRSGMLTDADLGVIIRHGRPPFVCLEIMRRIMFEALRQDAICDIPPEMMNGVVISMERSLWELNLNFGACLKINGTRMPASYTVFMRSFVIFFFILASFTWAPQLQLLTPIITGFMVFLINTVIVIGDQMMHPFDLQWAGLALQKFCVIIEHEVMNVSRRHADVDCLFV